MEKMIYRERIYNNYVQARATALAPDTVAGLKPRAPYLQRTIKRYFPKDRNAAILDLGCGYGAILYFAREAGYTNIYGIDGSPEQVAAAQRLGIEGVEEGDMIGALANLGDSSQDCILTFDVIEHLTREELIPFVDDVFRVLKAGGRWIIHTCNGESPFFGRILFGDLTHELAFTRTSLAQLMFSSKFTEIESYEDEPVPHGIKSTARWLLWRMIRGVLNFCITVETGDAGKDAMFSQNFLTVAVK